MAGRAGVLTTLVGAVFGYRCWGDRSGYRADRPADSARGAGAPFHVDRTCLEWPQRWVRDHVRHGHVGGMMMTVTRGARGQMVVAMLLGLAGLAMAGFMPLLTDASLEPREIVVVASDMAFYVDGNAEANPRIRMEAGETVRLVLWNKQPGVVHEFVVGAWQVATPRLRGRERDSLVFQVPEAIGHYVYECSPHSAMMRGSIEVVDVQ